MKQLTMVFWALVTISFAGCVGEVDPNAYADDVKFAEVSEEEDSETCVTNIYQDVYHNVEYSTKTTYVSEEGDAYNVWIDYEKKTDFDLVGDTSYSGKDISMIAHWIAEVYKKKGYSNADSVKEKLQNMHVVVTHTLEEIARLYDPVAYEDNPEEAVEYIKNTDAFVYPVIYGCEKNIAPEANFYFIIKANEMEFSNVDTTIHELMHPVSYYGWGDVDEEHDDPRLWINLSDNSIMAEVYDMWWDYMYGDEGSVWEQN